MSKPYGFRLWAVWIVSNLTSKEQQQQYIQLEIIIIFTWLYPFSPNENKCTCHYPRQLLDSESKVNEKYQTLRH